MYDEELLKVGAVQYRSLCSSVQRTSLSWQIETLLSDETRRSTNGSC